MKEIIVAAFFVLAGLATSAGAEQPVAVVEEVHGKVTGAEFMDYVTPKTVIKLGPTGSIVLSYMTSCRRETITGIGAVIVGTDESMVQFADVKSERMACDSSRSHETTRETSEVAATVLRSLGSNVPTIKPQVTLYGASPLVEARGRGTLLIERVDLTGERQQIDLSGNQLKGKFFDFAGANRTLTPGGTYLATFGTSKVVFRIDSLAKPGQTPIIGRLLRME
jgi:hypothetical protein